MAEVDDVRTSSGVTFSLIDEDHTIGNSVRFILNQDPRVTFCGYSVPHPSDNKVNVRVQTTGAPARQVLQEAFTELAGFCQHVSATFEAAIARFEAQGGASVNANGMEVDDDVRRVGREVGGGNEEEEEEEVEAGEGMES